MVESIDQPVRHQASADAPASTDELVERIINEMEPVMLHQREAFSRVWQDRSVSKAQLYLLMLLEQHGRVPMGRLASLMDVALPNLTGIVDRMEEHGLVERVRDSEDRRVVLVQATGLGNETLNELQAQRRDYLRRVLCAMSPTEQRNCYHAFQAIRRVSDRLTNEPRDAATSAPIDPAKH